MSDKITFRKAKEVDVLAISNLEDACFEHPYPEKEVRYEILNNPVAEIYVALRDDDIVGYIDYMITFDSSSITRLCVNSSSRRMGIGQGLLDKMFLSLSKQKDPVEFATLEVRASNEEAIRLYKKNGYSQVTIKKSYYDDGEDAIYMVRSLIA